MGQLIPLPQPRAVWSNALEGFVGPMLTFNYDIALEITVGRLPVAACDSTNSSSNTSASTTSLFSTIARNDRNEGHSEFQSGILSHSSSQTVVHLHGIYTHDQSVVLRLQSYLQAVKAVSETFVSLAEQGFIFLCVGIKGVLCDPDLFPYWRWEDVRQRIHDRTTRPCKKTHFVIFREDEDVIFPRRVLSNNSLNKGLNDAEYSFFKKITVKSYDEVPSIVKDIVNGQFREKRNAFALAFRCYPYASSDNNSDNSSSPKNSKL